MAEQNGCFLQIKCGKDTFLIGSFTSAEHAVEFRDTEKYLEIQDLKSEIQNFKNENKGKEPEINIVFETQFNIAKKYEFWIREKQIQFTDGGAVYTLRKSDW